MGFLDKIFGEKRPDPQVSSIYKVMNGYSPGFTTRSGSIYEADLIRSCVHAFAVHASKLKPEMPEGFNTKLSVALDTKPNPWQDTTKFLYRLATILEVNTTAYIVPITAYPLGPVVGLYPILPTRTEVVDVDGEPWLRYQFADGSYAAIEYSRVGILNKFQYADEFFGAGNAPLDSTLGLIHAQEQGLQAGIKNSAAIRFIVKLTSQLKSGDITAERDRFTAENLSLQNDSGVLFVDNKYESIEPIQSKPFTIDFRQTELIHRRVFNYFGTHEGILQNRFTEEEWGAYYEGKVEQFALQLGLVLTNMLLSDREIAAGKRIVFSSNRLQYASTKSKLEVTNQLVDRGIMSNYQAAEVWNLPKPPGEERWVIRGEYIDIDKLGEHAVKQTKAQPDSEKE